MERPHARTTPRADPRHDAPVRLSELQAGLRKIVTPAIVRRASAPAPPGRSPRPARGSAERLTSKVPRC